MSDETPLMRQYNDIKKKYPDAILLFRMGDFYEMFFDDAQDGGRILDLTLTRAARGPTTRPPCAASRTMPSRRIRGAARRSAAQGGRSASRWRTRKAKGLVRREVIRVVTPGTVSDPSQLEAQRQRMAGRGRVRLGRRGGRRSSTPRPESSSPSNPRKAATPGVLGRSHPAFSLARSWYPEGFSGRGVQAPRTGGALLTPAEAFRVSAPAAAADLLKPSSRGRLPRRASGSRPAGGGGGRGGDSASTSRRPSRTGLEHIDGISVPRAVPERPRRCRPRAEPGGSSARSGRRAQRIAPQRDRFHRRPRGGTAAATMVPGTAPRHRGDRKATRRRGGARREKGKEARGAGDPGRRPRHRTPARARRQSGRRTPGTCWRCRNSLQRLPILIDSLAGLAAPRLVRETPTGSTLASTSRPSGQRTRGRSARAPQGGRRSGAGFNAGARRAARDQHRTARESIAALEAAGADTHRHRLAQGPLQQGLRLLHRGHEGEPATSSPTDYQPQADARQRGALRHAGAEGVRGEGARRRGAHRAAGVRALRASSARGVAREADRTAGRPRRRWPASTCLASLAEVAARARLRAAA